MGAMLLIGAILAIGLMFGIGLGGSVRYFGEVRIRAWWLAPIAVILQAVRLPEVEGELGQFVPVAGLVASFFLLAIIAGANVRLRGFGLVLLGLILNLTVISLNQGMPVSAHALREISHAEDIEELRTAERGDRHHLATEEDLLKPIGDVVPFRDPFDTVTSPGDLLLYGGVAVFIATALLGRARRDPEPETHSLDQAMWS